MNTTETDLILAEQVLRYMREHGCTLSTAESCTSGRIAATLTSVSGASDYFQGSLVVYQNHLKTRLLGVPEDLIEKHDVVSEPVVRAMVQGCLAFFHTDFAIASTGYTGGGSDRVPSGTVWLGWGSKEAIHTLCLTTSNGREANTAHAAQAAIQGFIESLPIGS